MNARVLELLQRPENISKEDISLLQNEISKFPYMQSIRTLHLSAILISMLKITKRTNQNRSVYYG